MNLDWSSVYVRTAGFFILNLYAWYGNFFRLASRRLGNYLPILGAYGRFWRKRQIVVSPARAIDGEILQYSLYVVASFIKGY